MRGWKQAILYGSAATVVGVLLLANGVSPISFARESQASLPLKPEAVAPPPTVSAPSNCRSILQRFLVSPESETSELSAQLIVLAQSDPEVLALLVRQLGEARSRPAVIATLARIGSPAIEPVAALLAHPNAEVRWSALRVLLCLPDPPDSIAKQVVALIDDPDVHVRRWSVMYLAKLNDSLVTDTLIAASANPDGEVRWRAVRGLQSHRTLTREMEIVFERANHDSDPDVRYVVKSPPWATAAK